MTDDTVAKHVQNALAEIDRLSTRLRRRRLFNALRTIRRELLAARQALITQALATPPAWGLAADANTPAVTVIARPRSETGSARAPAEATRRRTDATAPVWNASRRSVHPRVLRSGPPMGRVPGTVSRFFGCREIGGPPLQALCSTYLIGVIVERQLKVPSPKGVVACTLTRHQLRSLVTIALPRDRAASLPRVYFDPRDGLIAAATAHSMLWKRQHFRSSLDAFSVSGAACSEALKHTPDDHAPIEIWVSETHVHTRRRITLIVGREAIVDLEDLAPYPQPRGALAVRPTRDPVVFPDTELSRLQDAMMEASGRKELALYVMRRGRAPAFVVGAVSELLGFMVPATPESRSEGAKPAALRLEIPAPELELAARWMRATLREFDIRETVRDLAGLPPRPHRRRARAPRDGKPVSPTPLPQPPAAERAGGQAV
jgi:hypothetical protein